MRVSCSTVISISQSFKKRPLYEGKLLDRDIHIAEFDVPTNSLWMGSTLKELNLGKKYGVHISSILRGGFRMNIPDGDYTIFPCDRLQVIGSDEQMACRSLAVMNRWPSSHMHWRQKSFRKTSKWRTAR